MRGARVHLRGCACAVACALTRALTAPLPCRHVPISRRCDVRARAGDRCGFGWSLHAALSNFGRSYGTRGVPGYVEACDLRGGVLPFPYGTGAGYIFSGPLLRWVATSPLVTGWVADARGADREELQWQKFEDTSTGYWLSHSPRTIQHVDIGPQIHDAACHLEGGEKRELGGTYRPPANVSVLVHNLKTPSAFAFAWHRMRGEGVPYDHTACMREVCARPSPGTCMQ